MPYEAEKELRAEIEQLRQEIERISELNMELRAEIERLLVAIRWALGEAPDEDGEWFGDACPPPETKYWWRAKLRRAVE